MKTCVTCGMPVLKGQFTENPNETWEICPYCHSQTDFKTVAYPLLVKMEVNFDALMCDDATFCNVFAVKNEMDTYWDIKNQRFCIRVRNQEDEDYLWDNMNYAWFNGLSIESAEHMEEGE